MKEEPVLNQEKALLSLMTKATLITDLRMLLNTIAQDSPNVIGAAECWIYLQPKFVDSAKSDLRFPQTLNDLIVLAATNKKSKLTYIGNDFFRSGEGITGWVYKHSRVLRIGNVLNDKELIQISPDIFWANKYSDENETLNTNEKYPLLSLPLIFDEKAIGTLEFHRTIDGNPFSEISEERAVIVSRILIAVLRNLRAQETYKTLLISLVHEINTPLTGILADSENIYHEAPENSDLKKMAEHNLGQVLRLHMQASTIMSVLLEQKSVRQFTEHSVFRPLMEARQLFESEAEAKGFEITAPKALDGNFPKVEMSLFDLTTAFKNIIHNAVKYSYMPPQGSDSRRYIKLWGEWGKDKDNYLVHVQNYGVGISQNEIEEGLIFKPFYRGVKASDRRRTGSGFGLAQARSTIEDLHHGSITVTSVPQAGDAYLTTFTISLPVKQPKE